MRGAPSSSFVNPYFSSCKPGVFLTIDSASIGNREHLVNIVHASSIDCQQEISDVLLPSKDYKVHNMKYLLQVHKLRFDLLLLLLQHLHGVQSEDVQQECSVFV